MAARRMSGCTWSTTSVTCPNRTSATIAGCVRSEARVFRVGSGVRLGGADVGPSPRPGPHQIEEWDSRSKLGIDRKGHRCWIRIVGASS